MGVHLTYSREVLPSRPPPASIAARPFSSQTPPPTPTQSIVTDNSDLPSSAWSFSQVPITSFDGPIRTSFAVRFRINRKHRFHCLLYRHWCAIMESSKVLPQILPRLPSDYDRSCAVPASFRPVYPRYPIALRTAYPPARLPMTPHHAQTVAAFYAGKQPDRKSPSPCPETSFDLQFSLYPPNGPRISFPIPRKPIASWRHPQSKAMISKLRTMVPHPAESLPSQTGANPPR